MKDIMGNLQQKIKDDLKEIIKFKEPTLKEPLRFIKGTLDREPDKDLSDERVIKILKALRKNELELPTPDKYLLTALDLYIPKEVSEDEVKKWINKNIDFNQLKNRMQAMRPIMEKFGGRIDGNKVKEILQSWNL